MPEARYWKAKSKLPWKSPHEASQLLQAAGRPIIVDVYTSWCYYCKVMDATTWSNDSVVQYINEKFYPIKFNAEDRNPINWFGKQYDYKTAYKVHLLAVELLRGNMVYPSTVIIPEKGDWEVIPGAMTPKEMEMLLKYFGEKANESMSFGEYQQQFKGKWK
jgi:thioredoxin-related protein